MFIKKSKKEAHRKKRTLVPAASPSYILQIPAYPTFRAIPMDPVQNQHHLSWWLLQNYKLWKIAAEIWSLHGISCEKLRFFVSKMCHQWPHSSSWRSAKKRSPSLLLLLSDAWATVEIWRISSISQLMAGLFPAILQRMARCLWTTQMLPPNFKSLENTRQQHINHFHPFLSITSKKSAASATTPPTNWWLAHTFSHSRAGSHPSRYTWDGRIALHKTLMCDSFQSHPIKQLQVAK